MKLSFSFSAVLLILVVAITQGRPAQADEVSQFVHDLEHQVLQPRIIESPGAAAVVVLDGRVVMHKAWGVRQSKGSEPIDIETLFRIASISKTFASAAAAILVKETDLSWQTPVKDTLDHLMFKRPEYGAKINLSHLMSQSTGLMPHAYTNLIEGRRSYQNIVGLLDQVDFVCPPGQCYGYQNVVFSLVGDVVKAKTGKTYTDFVEDKIFTPLQMSRASFGLNAFVKDTNHASPHVWSGTRWLKTRTTSNYYRVPPAAGINASIDDMRLWLLAQLGKNPKVLSKAMLDRMQTGVIATTRQQAHYRGRKGISNVHYGLGWRTFDYGGHTGFVQHGGYVRGMRAEMVFNRSLQIGMVFLTNSEPRGLSDLVFDYLDLYQLGIERVGINQAAELQKVAYKNERREAEMPREISSLVPRPGSDFSIDSAWTEAR